MNKQQLFIDHIRSGYAFDGPEVVFGAAMYEGAPLKEALVKLPLKNFNRHGLIAGATGTGKTKTLQVMAESLSDQGVPVMLMDIKGDLSGLAKPSPGHPKIDERHEKIGLPFTPCGYPVEFLTISKDKGVRMRATISEFGPILLSRILELNDTQSGVVSMIFKYCDDHDYPLVDIKDLRKVLQYAMKEGKAEFEEAYGLVSSASIGAINRKLIEVEEQGADLFFGEHSFEIDDLIRSDNQGKGIVSILRLTDIQDRPKLFSAFMLSLLAELYATLPEEGDMEKPKLVMFIDEAHLIFDSASDALLHQIEMIIKLIRSKGVGIFFCTQLPTDVPEVVLSQLGLRVQHALRAVTAKDRRTIKQTAENFPLSDFYKTDRVLTSLGIGEALITGLDKKGKPTPLAAVLLVAPRSRMDILTESELDAIIEKSRIRAFYNEAVDRKSAYEILKEKLEAFKSDAVQQDRKRTGKGGNYHERDGTSVVAELSKNTMVRQLGRTLVQELARGLLGAMGVKTTRRRR
jgi:DNA helicase HerA-like ATPase